MKIRAIPFSLLLLAPLSAQTWELGLFAGNQSYNSLSESMPGLTTKGSCTRKTVFGARLGYSVMELGPAMLQLTIGYQPSVTTTARVITQGTSVPGQPPTDSGPLDYKSSNSSVGVMFNFKAMIAVGLGMEIRHENLNLLSDSATYTRPWFRANFGMVFSTPVVMPFIGAELAVTPISESKGWVKALAPKTQFGVYGGIRF